MIDFGALEIVYSILERGNYKMKDGLDTCRGCLYENLAAGRQPCVDCRGGDAFAPTLHTQARNSIDDATPAEWDAVTNVKHYQVFEGIEAIDIIKQVLTPQEFKGYCKGNALKYRLRAGKKDNVEQDIAKAQRYEEML